MLGVDLKITRKEERAAERLKVFEENRKHTFLRDTILLSDASTSEDEEDLNQPGPSSKSPTDCTKITSIRRSRLRLQKERAENIRNKYKISINDSITIHWDGKLLLALTGKYNVDRLPIVASCNGKEQLLGVPALDIGTGVDQANTIFQTLEDWCVTDNIQALCCDTTASNMGLIKYASVLLKNLLQRNILYMPCRHHIFEIVLRSVFEVKFGITTSGSDVLIFIRFREFWSNVNTTHFEPGIKNEYVEKLLHNVNTEIIEFCISYLNNRLPREDYRELLELTIIFLGEVWFKAPLTSSAPLQDLTFLKDLIKYQSVDKSISDISIKKCVGIYGIESLTLFNHFKINTEFLKIDPSSWQNNENYKKAAAIIKNIPVVNDIAEQEVKLIEEYNDKITKDESQKQYLLQVVYDYRKTYPDSRKGTLRKK
ncbi:hypothetical protein QTP88_025463 [Uroleucon formosanum]